MAIGFFNLDGFWFRVNQVSIDAEHPWRNARSLYDLNTRARRLLTYSRHNYGGADRLNSTDLTRSRRVTRAALYRQLDDRHQPQNWGIQFWNGDGEKMISIFLPNPFLGAGEDFLPEYQPDLAKLTVYENLRQIHVLGRAEIPYQTNPLAHP